jgi:hypothetical protein
MGLTSRRKGANGERELVAFAKQHGLSAERCWSTAQHSDPAVRACDVRIAGRPAQVKRQADGFAALYDGLQDVEFLFLRTDGEAWLAVIRAEELFKLIREKMPVGETACNP